MRIRLDVAAVLGLVLAGCVWTCAGQAVPPSEKVAARGAEWANVAAHLPDMDRASSAQLETAADVLRARRFQQESMRFYNAALARGGNGPILLKKMGIACLELQQLQMARAYFERAVKLDRQDGSAWNDLAAAEFSLGNLDGSVHDYKHAIKMDKRSAVFHSNLALAYLEGHNVRGARRELAQALKLDPDLLHRGGRGGYTAQLLASTRYAEVCFEMARIYAAQNDVPTMLEWLTRASDRGFDVSVAMQNDTVLRTFLAHPDVQALLQHAADMHGGSVASAQAPSLGQQTTLAVGH